MISAIRKGSFPEGRVPPEDQLAELLGVSRTTVRRALQSLEQIGLIERRPGRGTRLRMHAKPDLLALHGLVPFPTLLRELGHEVTSQVSWRLRKTIDPELDVRLGRKVTDGSYEIKVVLLADGEPAVAMRERFPVDVTATPSEGDLQSGSILFISDRCFKDKINHALATIEPRNSSSNVDDEIDGALGLADGVAYLALHETFYSSEEKPLAISQVSVAPSFVTFSVFRRFV
jgi:GntR family transcriptional regulator